MKGPLITFSVVLIFCALQATLFREICSTLAVLPGLSVFAGQTVDVTLILLVYLTLLRSRWSRLLWIAIIVLLTGSFGAAWKGSMMVSYFAVAIFCSAVQRHVLLESRSTVGLFVAVITLVEAIVHHQLGGLFARIPDPLQGQLTVFIAQMVLNALAAPLCFDFFTWMDSVSGVKDIHSRRGELILEL